MKHFAIIATVVVEFFSMLQMVSAEGTLEDAHSLIKSRQYDAAIKILDQHLRERPSSADGHLLRAHAYHWKKDLEKAKTNYQKAAKLDRKYELEIIPLLDEQQDWNEVIRIASAAMARARQLSPAVLGSFASAYRATEKLPDAERIISTLTATEYKDQASEDYKNYVLAYYHLWHDDKEKSKERLKKIKDKAYLKFALSNQKFEKLQTDAEFLELAKQDK